ncbi:MAG: GntR family transcriptional regulator [bacterium]
MIITVDLSNPKPTYLQIVEAIRRAVATGALKPGDQLPTIRDVAIQARVNRNTVSRAYLELEHQGLVRSRQGSGSYISDDGPSLAREERVRVLKRMSDELALEAYHYRIPINEVAKMLEESAAELGKEAEDE